MTCRRNDYDPRESGELAWRDRPAGTVPVREDAELVPGGGKVDTDIEAILNEIRPDGSSLLLGSDVIRTRFRESVRAEKLVKPGEVLRYELGDFNWIARRLGKGSQLRLTIGAPNSIYAKRTSTTVEWSGRNPARMREPRT